MMCGPWPTSGAKRTLRQESDAHEGWKNHCARRGSPNQRYHVRLDLNGLLRSARSLGSHQASICTRTTSPNPADPDRSFDTDCPTLHHCTDMYSLTAYPHQSLSRRADSVQNRLQPQITHPRAPRMQNARLGKGQLPMWCWPGTDVCPPRVRTPAVIRPPSRMAGINISTLGPASRAQGKQQ